MATLAVFIFIFLGNHLNAQEYNLFDKQFQKIKELVNNDLYSSAEQEIVALNKSYPNIGRLQKSRLEAMGVLCAIKLERPNLDARVEAFEREYPYSPELSSLKFHHSLYYFGKNDYSRALLIMDSVEKRHLQRDEKLEYSFNHAYCDMRVGKNREAMTEFEQLVSMPQHKFTPSSIYYLAYIYYINREFDMAVPLFNRLVKDDRYSLLSRYYLAESHFMLKNYDYVIAEGTSLYEDLTGDYKIRITRILSEAYFDKGNTKEAKKYLDIYTKSGTHLSRKDNYFAGVISYSLEGYLSAINEFGKVASKDDTLGQSAYFHLGNSYLKIKNKHEALKAFKAASETDFDKILKEEALFNYAKLAFDVNSDIAPFNQYLTDYPSSEKSDEINNYIGTAFLLSKNYKSAIEALTKINNPQQQTTLNLQKAAFFRGMQLFSTASYRSAINSFNLSINNGTYNKELVLLTSFWLAESHYRANEFARAVKINTELINNKSFLKSAEYPTSVYNLAYAYFKSENYLEAMTFFKQYLDFAPNRRSMTTEAKTRLADCYFMMREYDRAAELYEEVIGKGYNSNDIYAAYQGAISYGLIAKDEKKITMLKDIVANRPNSILYPKALYELGRTYVQVSDNQKAIESFNLLLQNEKDSTFYSKSLLELGMINTNMAHYEEALINYSTIVEKKPMSEEAESALLGIESIYQIQNKPEEYLAYLERIGRGESKSVGEKEMMLFNSAEQIFLSGNYNDAQKSLKSFITKYPNGAKTPLAYFYLGEALNKLGKPELAADAYLKVMESEESSFAELSTLNYGKISLALEKYDKAIQAFETLSLIAKLENNKFEAKVGKMRAYYYNKDYSSAISNAKNLLASEKLPPVLSDEANYIIAKSLLITGKRGEATPILQKLASNTISPEGAEASYLLVIDAYDEGDFKSVEERVYAFSDSKTPHTYWLAKSFIVLGDSFAERDEWEQAEATFKSIKEGYKPQKENDDVLEQIDMRLKKINQKK